MYYYMFRIFLIFIFIQFINAVKLYPQYTTCESCATYNYLGYCFKGSYTGCMEGTGTKPSGLLFSESCSEWVYFKSDCAKYSITNKICDINYKSICSSTDLLNGACVSQYGYCGKGSQWCDNYSLWSQGCIVSTTTTKTIPSTTTKATIPSTQATTTSQIPSTTKATIPSTTTKATTTKATTTPLITTSTQATTTPLITTSTQATTTPLITTSTQATTTQLITSSTEATTTPLITTSTEATTTPLITTSTEATTTPLITTSTEATTTPVINETISIIPTQEPIKTKDNETFLDKVDEYKNIMLGIILNSFLIIFTCLFRKKFTCCKRENEPPVINISNNDFEYRGKIELKKKPDIMFINNPLNRV
jgi:hypothetical protein